MFHAIVKDMEKLANPEKAKLLSGFFKTGKGEYGEGDVFLGISVPETRKIAQKHKAASFEDIAKLLDSRIHEHRLAALLLLVEKYSSADEKGKKEIVGFYLKNTKKINNWDLVDLSSHKILGDYLFSRDKSVLYKLARSSNLWEKRIAIISTFAFINRGKFSDSFKIAEMLMTDKHDLIHKAIGWMLREIGKRDQNREEKFLMKHCKTMPRTALRYAIERFDEKKKQLYMGK
jgi:3-methyladenine DNA glycosylase AlkD